MSCQSTQFNKTEILPRGIVVVLVDIFKTEGDRFNLAHKIGSEYSIFKLAAKKKRFEIAFFFMVQVIPSRLGEIFNTRSFRAL